jgi:hypothetical protein
MRKHAPASYSVLQHQQEQQRPGEGGSSSNPAGPLCPAPAAAAMPPVAPESADFLIIDGENIRTFIGKLVIFEKNRLSVAVAPVSGAGE